MPKSPRLKRPLKFRLLIASISAIAILAIGVGVGLAQGGEIFLPLIRSSEILQGSFNFEDMNLPVIDYWPWETRSENPDDAPITKATPTPDDFAAKNLPTVVPPALPTGEVIDTAPDESYKYGIIIRRASTNAEAVILMPPNDEFQKILQAFLEKNDTLLNELLKPYLQEGDEFVTLTPPTNSSGGPRPQPTGTTVP